MDLINVSLPKCIVLIQTKMMEFEFLFLWFPSDIFSPANVSPRSSLF